MLVESHFDMQAAIRLDVGWIKFLSCVGGRNRERILWDALDSNQ